MKVMFVFMLKLLRHFVPPPSSPARGEVPRRGDGEGEQRRSWNTILLLKLKLGNQKASALRGWNLKFKI